MKPKVEGWFHRENILGEHYTAQPRTKVIYHIPGNGTRNPTPQEIYDALQEHPNASLTRDGFLLHEYDYQDTEETPVALPPGCYRYFPSPHPDQPESLVPIDLREDKVVKMPGITRQIVKDVQVFLENEDLYREIGIQYRRGILLYGPPGQGKCLGRNTPILMFDGTTKMVQDIQIGDLVMGPDSCPRKVVSTTSGRERLYEVVPKKGDSFVCNESHILSIRASGLAGKHQNGDVINISVKDYLKKSNNFKAHTFLYRAGVDFNESPVAIDPYTLGYWLGDGDCDKARITTADEEVLTAIQAALTKDGLHLNQYGASGKAGMYGLTDGNKGTPNPFTRALREHNLIGHKHIPLVYRANSRHIRLQVLAGLIDSDGFVNDGCFTFSTTTEELADDVTFLARSLGFAAYKKRLNKTKKAASYKDAYYVYVSGDMSLIPTRVERKKLPPRKQHKNVLHTGFELEDMGEGDYYGFELEGNDKLFLLGDFTVTHNTTMLREIIKEEVPDDSIVIFMSELPSLDMLKKLQVEEAARLKVIIFEELTSILGRNQNHIEEILDFLDGEASLDRALIFGTTNYPEKIPGNIVNRPSRFDRLIKVGNPDRETGKELLTFYLCREPTEEEVDAVMDMSVAEIKEAAIISRLHKTTVEKAVLHFKQIRELVEKEFEESSPIGLGKGSSFPDEFMDF